LLKAKTESSGVASKLIATTSDLDQIAAGERQVAALSGWRREVFGEDALRLCNGEVALAAKGKNVAVIKL
jgi:ribonuclease D